MRHKLIILIIIGLILLAAVGIAWLANSDMMPPTHAVEQPIPDDQIPH